VHSALPIGPPSRLAVLAKAYNFMYTIDCNNVNGVMAEEESLSIDGRDERADFRRQGIGRGVVIQRTKKAEWKLEEIERTYADASQSEHIAVQPLISAVDAKLLPARQPRPSVAPTLVFNFGSYLRSQPISHSSID